MFNKRISTWMADQLEAYAWTTLGNLRYAWNTYNDYKKSVKLSRDEPKMWENKKWQKERN